MEKKVSCHNMFH